MSVSELRAPESASTRPSGSRVPVGYQRLKVIGLTRIHALTFGSKMSTSFSPSEIPDRSQPPSVITRPSASTAWPAHSRSTHGLGIAENTPVAGSHNVACVPFSQNSTFPVFSRCEWTPTGRPRKDSRPLPGERGIGGGGDGKRLDSNERSQQQENEGDTFHALLRCDRPLPRVRSPGNWF